MEDFFKPWNELVTNGNFFGNFLTSPSVNITDNKDEYRVELAAPGLKKSDFDIDLEGNMITISSQKEESKSEKESKYTRKEYSYSSFSRSFTLPDHVKQDKIEARYEDGVLKVILPKKEEAKQLSVSKHIAVN